MSWFRKSIKPLGIDLHSHLIPNIDDGSQSVSQSISMIAKLIDLGYEKIITTPHIHPNYPNTPQIIRDGFSRLQDGIKQHELDVELEVAAEYYVDETFLEKVRSDTPILSFGGNHVLVESSFINKPAFFDAAMFDLIAKGYIPILAHPERYKFLEGKIDWLNELKSMGVLLQVTLGSIGGYYGTKPQSIAKLLLKKRMVDFLGSDLHGEKHIPFLKKGLESSEVQRVIKSGVLKHDVLA